MPQTRVRPSSRLKASYLDLVRRFPLRPIRSENELDDATRVINSLLDRPRLDSAQRDYLDVLGDLVESYEEKHYPMEAPTDAEVLAYLLELNNLRQSDLAGKTGIAGSTISEVLAGKRKLTRGQIEKLAAFFQVAPGVFFGVP